MSWTENPAAPCHYRHLAEAGTGCVNNYPTGICSKLVAVEAMSMSRYQKNGVTDAQALWAKDVCLCAICMIAETCRRNSWDSVATQLGYHHLATLEVDTVIFGACGHHLVTGGDAAHCSTASR